LDASVSGTNTGDNAVNSLYSGVVTNATHTGDAEGATSITVKKINGVALSGLASGILMNTTATGVPSVAVAGTDYLSPTTGWSLNGNSGTTPGTNFIGTTDNKALVFKVNSEKVGEVSTGTNTSFGYQTLNENTGTFNTAVGGYALYANTTAKQNTAYGSQALLNNTSGDNNTANGYQAGRYAGSISSTTNQTSSNSVYLGAYTSAFADAQTNEIVIGYHATGAGSNTATLGNTSITTTVLRGNVKHYGTSTGYVGLQAPATVATPYSLTLPTAAPASNGQVLSATTAGVLSWATAATPLAIGDSYGGGIVFYVYDGGRHGLIAATADQSTGIRWYAGTYTNTMAYADGVGAGKANTAIIIANQGYGDGVTYASRICNEYSVTAGGVTYGDWYLPSKYELNLMYSNIGQGAASPNTNVGGFASAYYWSSSEYSNNYAWGQNFNVGNQTDGNKVGSIYVRAVRAF
jgi:hypothetical protein